jgi:hypothetical protein
MDLKFLTDSLPFNAQRIGREEEIVNQQRQAQAVQMLQEARLKAEMQPLDMDLKRAQAGYQRSLAEEAMQRAKTSSQDRYAGQVAKKQESDELLATRSNRARIEAILNAAKKDRSLDTGPMLDEIVPSLPSDVRSILRPSPNTNMYDDESLQTALRVLGERDPEVAKNLRNEMSVQGRYSVAEMQQERANDRKKWDLELQEKRLKQQESLKKSMANVEQQMLMDKAAYKKSPTPETKKAYEESYSDWMKKQIAVQAWRMQNDPDMGSMGIDTLGNIPTTPPDLDTGDTLPEEKPDPLGIRAKKGTK